MSINTKYGCLVGRICSVVLALALVMVAAGSVPAKRIYWGRTKKTIVLDPGHGGNQPGARRPDGLREKEAALDFARILQTELKKDYRVQLTREGDYGIEIEQRTAVANQIDADALISIHAGGGFSRRTGGIWIYYFKDSTGPVAAETSKELEAANEDSVILWDRIQLKHLGSSRLLAKSIQNRLAVLKEVSSCSVGDAPLLVLRGADMPAIVLEIGYLTNPADGKAIEDPAMLQRLAQAVAVGIQDFFKALGKAREE